MTLVVVEHDRGEMTGAGREALTFGRQLAADSGSDTTALLIGASAADLADECARFGADEVVVAEHDLLADYGAESWGETLVQALEDTSADSVVATGTDRGNEILAQAAARLDAPFVANCISIDPSTDPWSITRVRWGGSLHEDCTLTSDLKLVTVAHHAVEPVEADGSASASPDTFTPALADDLARTSVRDRVVLSEGITLSTSPVVVGGGRGVGSPEGFAALEELAELLGGVVGCSRAVTNNGWRPHSDQVGQTGTRIAPNIYIASGISGAIQHWVGAMAAKHILAINTDPEANMVVKADHAVIGDLHEVVPAISEEIRKRRA